jgi:hypothetical protein
MSFWSWWSRKLIVGEPAPISQEPMSFLPGRTPVITDADRQYVRNALDRFEASGLQIWSELDRELIVVRALADAQRRIVDRPGSNP